MLCWAKVLKFPFRSKSWPLEGGVGWVAVAFTSAKGFGFLNCAATGGLTVVSDWLLITFSRD
jgi:hypothetical protein